ncbi:MAG: CDP-glycerol glycerophosphotransferase family protein [Clostridiales bacterium]|nr:CDP-glycerol glycerophosphotransferase family protein [Clostridiales bacterium]
MSVLGAGKAVLRGIYGLHKKAATRPDRVAIISRQSNAPSIDIRLLRAALEKNGDVDVRVLCKTLDGGILRKIGYLFHMIGPQMHAIATSKVVVLDSYCIAVSILEHKKDLTVIQMWHAMGALKKFGKSILGQAEGSSRALAEEMQMHRGYDVLLASSEASLPFFAEAFGYEENRFWILPLPRTDLLRDKAYMEARREEILKANPQLAGRKILLYAPTMRKTGEDLTKPVELAREVQKYGEYLLVVSPHPVTGMQEGAYLKQLKENGAQFLPDCSTLDLLSVCDVFISDYSAAVFEAAAAGKPVCLYAYDLDKYLKTRGFYLDYEKEMPGIPYRTAEEVMRAVADGVPDPAQAERFAARYIAPVEHTAEELASRIRALLRERK